MDPIVFDLSVNPSASEVQEPQPEHNPWEPSAAAGAGAGESGILGGLLTQRRGRSFGVEALLRVPRSERLFGWVSYSFSKSERRTDLAWRPFDFDRTHVLNLVLGIRLPRNWELGGRVLLQTGTPLTTLFGLNTARSDGQVRFDLRIDKRAVWDGWMLDFYVDLINVTVSPESGGLVGGDAAHYLIPTLGLRAVL